MVFITDGGISPLLQALPSALTSHHFAQHNDMEVIIDGPLAKAKDGVGFRAFSLGACRKIPASDIRPALTGHFFTCLTMGNIIVTLDPLINQGACMASIEIDESTIRYLKENPEARMAAIDEVYRLIREGDVDVAKITLRMIINLTCGFPAISNEVGRHPKSIMRMLTPDVDPGIKAFMSVVNATKRQIVNASKGGMNDAQ